MSWKGIEKKYPETYQKWLEWDDCLIHNKVLEQLYEDSYNIRNLYDFFDEQEIYIQISVKCAMDNSVWYLVYIWAGMFDEHLQDKATRKEAEEAAFEKAFEILENKL